jgi:hypothetical protein
MFDYKTWAYFLGKNYASFTKNYTSNVRSDSNINNNFVSYYIPLGQWQIGYMTKYRDRGLDCHQLCQIISFPRITTGWDFVHL